MKAALLYKPKRIEISEIDEPQLGPDDIRIKPKLAESVAQIFRCLWDIVSQVWPFLKEQKETMVFRNFLSGSTKASLIFVLKIAIIT